MRRKPQGPAHPRELEEAPPLEPDARRIAEQAYQRWVARGRAHGRHEEDWLEAERALRLELAAARPAGPEAGLELSN